MSEASKQYVLRRPIIARRDSDIERGKYCKPGYDNVIVTSLPASWDAEQTNKYEIDKDVFDELFVSVEDIQQQIEQLFANEIAEFLESYHATRGEVYIEGELSRKIQGILVKNSLDIVYGKEKP